MRYTIGPLPCYPVLPKAVNNINQKLYFDLFEYSWMPYLVNNLFCNFQRILILSIHLQFVSLSINDLTSFDMVEESSTIYLLLKLYSADYQQQ